MSKLGIAAVFLLGALAGVVGTGWFVYERVTLAHDVFEDLAVMQTASTMRFVLDTAELHASGDDEALSCRLDSAVQNFHWALGPEQMKCHEESICERVAAGRQRAEAYAQAAGIELRGE